MELLFEHKTRGFWLFIVFILLVVYVISYQAVKDYQIENQKITIGCSKTKDFCIVQKTYPNIENGKIVFKYSNLKTVSPKHISRGCYDVEFFFKNDHTKRLYGGKNCSTNPETLKLITEGFFSFALNNERKLIIKTGENFYLYWMDYFAPIALFVFLCIFFMFPKKQEIYIDSKYQNLFSKRYNLFNYCSKRVFNMLNVDEFYSKYYNYSFFIVCRMKNKKTKIVSIVPTDRQNDAQNLCDTLNGFLASIKNPNNNVQNSKTLDKDLKQPQFL